MAKVGSDVKPGAEMNVPGGTSGADVPPRTTSALTWPGRVYAACVILAGICVIALAGVDVASRSIDPEWAVLIALTIGSGWATLRIPGMPISFSISDVFSIASALLFGPAAGAITAALDGVVVSYRMATSARSFYRIAFNASAPAIAIAVAAVAFRAMAGETPNLQSPATALWFLLALTVFGALDYMINTGMVALAVSLERRLPVIATWREHFSGLWLSYFGGVFGGMLLMLLARSYSQNVIILLIPLPIILYTAFRHAVGRTEDHINHLGKVNRVYVAAIEALAQAVDAKDQVTHDHVRRVQHRAVELARGLGVDGDLEVQAIKAASLLHDVGKLAIPEHILNKPGRLTAAEYEIMKRHAPIGADILSVIDFPYPVAPIVRHHHENWDGSGYPDGLAGEAIPMGARILSVVDCFDALTSDRPYRPRIDDHAAMQVLLDRRGTMYDPRVVDAFCAFLQSAPLSEPTPPAVTLRPAAPTPAKAPGLEIPPDLKAFFDLGRALSVAVRRDRACDVLWRCLEPLLPPVTLVLYAYDGGSDSIAAVGEAGRMRFASRPDTRFAVGERLSGWVAATGQVIINSDARLDLDEQDRAASRFRSALVVRIDFRGEILGVLSAYSCNADIFTPSHQRALQAAASAFAAGAGNIFRPSRNFPVAS
jgi:putative nucleotidyltransferase with HDIG domain